MKNSYTDVYLVKQLRPQFNAYLFVYGHLRYKKKRSK